MDVFSTVVSTINLIDKIVSYLQAARSAEEDQLKLLSETSALGAVLDILHRRLGKTDGNDDSVSNRLVKAGIGGPLDQCYGSLRSVTGELERIVPHADMGKSSSFAKKMKNLRWPFQQEGMRTILSKIERLKSLISLALQTSLMEFIERTHDELVVVGLNVEKIGTALSALETRQRVHMKEIESRHINLQDLGFTVQDSANNIAIVKDTVVTIEKNQQDQMVKGDRMEVDLTIIKEAVYGQELQELVKWLSPLDFSEKHNMAFERRTPGTGEWFLEHPKFLAWTRGELKTLWCPGDPGVGKSVMASLVIHELGEAIPENIALVFIYFEYKTACTMTQLVEVVLKQLVQRRITRSGLESLRKHKAGNRPTSNELLEILKVEVETYSRVLIVADALDEADVQIWAPLLRRLQALSGISLLATSRDIGDIALELQPDQRLDIMANEGDMRKYIKGRLSGSTGRFKRLLEANPNLHDEIITGVIKKADGMFLLAQLHMNSLETKVGRVTDLRLALAKLPRQLETTYSETLGRIDDEDRPLAYRIFSWLIHAVQPMTIRDLQYALAMEDSTTTIDIRDLYDEVTLTSICVGLVVLRENPNAESKDADPQTNRKIVGLVHYTTQEYFLDNNSTSMQLADSPRFAITCLKYLALDIFRTDGPLEDTQKRLTGIPFATYAIFSWGIHARMHCGDITVQRLAMELLHDNQRVVTVGSLPCRARDLSATHLCAHFGLGGYLGCLLDNGFDINSKDSDGDTAVTYAAMLGQEEILQLLLTRDGVDIAPKGWNGATPLIRAAMRGHQGIVALMSTNEAVDINRRDNHGGTAMAHAVEGGHHGIVELLLARDTMDINLPDKEGHTPLLFAVIRGHEEIVQLLLARNDVNTNSRDDTGSTPIIYAALGGCRGIVELLLARDGVDVNSRGQHGYTPLVYAILGGHEAIVRLLLARNDVNVNSCSDDGDTPIIHAARGGHGGILELLMEQDVDINSRGQHGYTPLACAILGGHEAIVRLLLARNDVNTNSRDDNGSTPIIYAAGKGYSEIMELLLARDGVDIGLRGQHGYTPLCHEHPNTRPETPFRDLHRPTRFRDSQPRSLSSFSSVSPLLAPIVYL